MEQQDYRSDGSLTVGQRLGRIEDSINKLTANIGSERQDLERRIRKLEELAAVTAQLGQMKRWQIAQLIALISAAAAAAAVFLQHR